MLGECHAVRPVQSPGRREEAERVKSIKLISPRKSAAPSLIRCKKRELIPKINIFCKFEPMIKKQFLICNIAYVLDVPSPIVIRAILRVAIFSIEVPALRYQKLFASGTEVLKMATEELPESNDRWGISFYVFDSLRLFSLNNGNLFSVCVSFCLLIFVNFLEFV